MNGGCNGKIIHKWWIFHDFPAMFDDTGGYPHDSHVHPKSLGSKAINRCIAVDTPGELGRLRVRVRVILSREKMEFWGEKNHPAAISSGFVPPYTSMKIQTFQVSPTNVFFLAGEVWNFRRLH